MPRVGLGFEPDADDEGEDHLIKPLIAHVYKTLGSIALRPHESNLGGSRNMIVERESERVCRSTGEVVRGLAEAAMHE
jgi:hypothetical protein